MADNERGAVLILTLVILLMMTAYGVVSTRDAKTQLQIAGNTQTYTQALGGAEGVLSKTEQTVRCLLTPPGNGTVPPTIVNAAPSFVPSPLDTSQQNLLATVYPGQSCVDGAFGGGTLLSASDLGQYAITVDLLKETKTPCGSNNKNPPDPNLLLRIDILSITVGDSNNGRGQRKVGSKYAVVADENC